jgi:hypothetical protein
VCECARDGRLLVAWMLTPNDGSRDGKFRSYLRDRETWRRYDPELFAGLAGLLRLTSIPEVSIIERSALLPRTSYYSAVVPDTGRERDAWRQGLFSAASDADLVFVDPDNGIEVASKPVGRKGSSKYVTWQETSRPAIARLLKPLVLRWRIVRSRSPCFDSEQEGRPAGRIMPPNPSASMRSW